MKSPKGTTITALTLMVALSWAKEKKQYDHTGVWEQNNFPSNYEVHNQYGSTYCLSTDGATTCTDTPITFTFKTDDGKIIDVPTDMISFVFDGKLVGKTSPCRHALVVFRGVGYLSGYREAKKNEKYASPGVCVPTISKKGKQNGETCF